jgi:hypothetical protein
MATCPHCLGALTDDHRCPKGTLSRIRDTASAVGIGGLAGTVLCFALEDRPVTALVLASAALGAVLAVGLKEAVVGRR